MPSQLGPCCSLVARKGPKRTLSLAVRRKELVGNLCRYFPTDLYSTDLDSREGWVLERQIAGGFPLHSATRGSVPCIADILSTFPRFPPG